MRKSLACIIAAIMLAIATINANAHTTAIGYVNSGPGSVTFWFKSWHSYTPPLFEGSFNIVGVNGNPYPDTTVAFDQTFDGTGDVRPPGLVDGVNLFYGCDSNGLCDTDEDNEGGDKWQGVTFTGLQAGDYQYSYIPAANPTADWRPSSGPARCWPD